MNILIFDTATSLESIILYTGGTVRTTVKDAGANHSAFLFDNIKALLDEAAIGISSINAIGVGIGPGSFTGIRIAVSTARMLAQVLNIPLIGIKTHDMFALSAADDDASFVLVAFDAKKNRVFGALYSVLNGKILEVVPAGDYTIDELLVPCPPEARLYAAGNGAQKYYEQITARIKNTILRKELRLNGEKISDMIIEKLKKDISHDYNSVVPFYARKPDAVSPSP